MSKFKYIAKIAVQSDFLTRKLFDFYTQLIVYSPSQHAIKQSKSLANTLGKGRVAQVSNSSESVFQSLALMECFELSDEEFIRIGPNHDGGYVLYKDISKVNKIISIGVAEDTSFEEDFNMKINNVDFFLFDHTVVPKRKLPENFYFFSLGLGKYNEHPYVNLEFIVDKHLKFGDRAILKIDIEGSEYLALQDTDVSMFSAFDQILIEIHDLCEETLCSELFKNLLFKLRANHHLVHVHGNNNDGYVLVKGACVPKTLELTFVNRRFEIQESKGRAIFPREMDYPNTTGDDLIIGAFKFRPSISRNEQRLN
jgi:hypothetical protein